MAKLKSERHHWWPECVSAHWKDDEGCTNWLTPDDEVRRAPPRNFGVIGNGHHIKMGSKAGEDTPFDESFEAAFHSADDHFPAVIAWLENLSRKPSFDSPIRERFTGHPASDDEIALLVESIVSLAVRSPKTRQNAVGLAERFRGPIPERERNTLIGMNLRNCQKTLVNSIGTRGKFAALYSPDREFIYGDGFFHNISAPSMNALSTKMLVPITPRISVLFARPVAYTTEPRLSTIVVSDQEAQLLNEAVQVYAKEALFFRSDRPALIDAFRQNRFLVYSDPRNSIDTLIDEMPGVQTRSLWPYDLLTRTLNSRSSN